LSAGGAVDPRISDRRCRTDRSGVDRLIYRSGFAPLRSRRAIGEPRLPLALFGLALIGNFAADSSVLAFAGNPIIFEFLFGAVIAKLPRHERLALPLLALAAVLFARSPLHIYRAEFVAYNTQSFLRPLFWGFPAALFVWGGLCLESRLTKAWAIPVLLGNASYSIYLVHPGVIELLNLWWPAEMLIAVLAGVVSWRLPIQRRKPRRRSVINPDQLHDRPAYEVASRV